MHLAIDWDTTVLLPMSPHNIIIAGLPSRSARGQSRGRSVQSQRGCSVGLAIIAHGSVNALLRTHGIATKSNSAAGRPQLPARDSRASMQYGGGGVLSDVKVRGMPDAAQTSNADRKFPLSHLHHLHRHPNRTHLHDAPPL